MIEHGHESDRLESLRSYGILDSGPDPDYDALTELAALICDTPIASVSLVDADRVWFKSVQGLAITQIPREASFCRYTVATGLPVVVSDATLDPRFATDSYVNGPSRLRAYAGVPLIGRDGLPLGTLCVLDYRPREFSAQQLAGLSTLAHQVVTLLEMGRLDQTLGRRPDPDAGELSDPIRLRAALDGGELHPHFQPLVDLATGRPEGFEALLRWEHPRLGLIMPGRFLPAIESSGLIMPVGRHVLREAVQLLARLRRRPEYSTLGMAVNLSLTQLAQPGMSRTVIQELESHAVPAQSLSLELTESAALHDDRVAMGELQALHETGVSLSIDDYGTGYSSLMRILDLPITTLKLDRSLIQRLPEDRRALAVARSTIDMATSLGIWVVAEGIEIPEQQAALLELGCRVGQGYLFGRAVPADAVPGLLEGSGSAGHPDPRPARNRNRIVAGSEPPAGRPSDSPPWSHAVQFYDATTELADSVARYLAPALHGPGAVLVVAVPDHHDAIRDALAHHPIDVGACLEQGRYVAMDAADLMAELVVDAHPDGKRFASHVMATIEALHERYGHVRVYGEVVALMWTRGQSSAAIELECLWNENAAAGTFSLYCAYPHEILEDTGVDACYALLAQHTGVIPADSGLPTPVPIQTSPIRSRLTPPALFGDPPARTS